MKDSANFSAPGYTTAAPPKPAAYEPTVDFAVEDTMDMSDQEEYEAVDFDCMDAGALSRCFAFSVCIIDACAVYVQKTESAPVTPVKSVGGETVAASPTTPVTTQKASTVKMEGGKSEL